MSSTRFEIYVKPGASRTAVGGTYDGRLIVAVTARPVDHAATTAAVAALARALGVRAGDVDIAVTRSRTKAVTVSGDVGHRLAHLLTGVGQ